MGHIKEPEGVDFMIQSKPLTDDERKEISKYIQAYKTNQSENKSIMKVKKSSSKQKVST
ncbi:hypothetical protein [Mucilaginibacter arboris]|uniref:hypothetical protein n=1 Tax=Mucilaginibacter arboris TaxID=2682090 RepID=UPI0018DC424B|nr:hypothetical protein [Mucilaginibacter arboris]